MLIAVSGGVDSMVLLHALHALAPQHGWRLVVAHFNHKLRGAASDADAMPLPSDDTTPPVMKMKRVADGVVMAG